MSATGPRKRHWHPVLLKQMRDAFGTSGTLPEGVEELLVEIERSYRIADDQRRIAKRSLATMTDELNSQNRELATQLDRVRKQAQVLHHIHDAVFAIDEEARLFAANAATAHLFARNALELERAPLEGLVQAAESETSLTTILEEARKNGRWVGDLHVLRPSGALAETTIVYQGLPGCDGAEFIAVARDVTDRRLMERQVFQSQKLEAIGQLAAGIAHEVNTPAQYVADNLRFLQEGHVVVAAALARWRAGEALTPDIEEELQLYESEVVPAIRQSLDGMARVAAIVNGMRTFAHPGGGQKSLVDLNAEIASTIAVTRNEWKYVSVVDIDFDPALPPVPAIPGEINHVFLNIIVNAAHAIEERVKRASQPPGRIRITTRLQDEVVEIRISDNGTGIPDSIRDRVFDPFFTTKAVGRGTGQGLAIVHRLVHEKHGGSIRFEPAPPHGTTFVIQLPLTLAIPAAFHKAA